MTCMTTKQKFTVLEPTVVVLANGKFAYREKCPWTGKNNKELFAYKFCSRKAYDEFLDRNNKENVAPVENSDNLSENAESED